MIAFFKHPRGAFRLAGFTALFSLTALAGCGGSGAKGPHDVSQSGSGPAEVGKPAPDLSIQTMNGKGKISLESMQGKILVVDFWATWCGPCKSSFPQLDALSKKVGDKVEVLGISVDDTNGEVLAFAKANGATFAIGWDEGHTIAQRWKVETMPTTFIVDGTGKVRYIHASYHDGETNIMEKEILALTEELSGGTRVAKSDAKPEAKEDPKQDAKEEPKPEPKADAKPETKHQGAGEATASNDEAKPEAGGGGGGGGGAPKKKGPKKGSGAGGKAKPPKKPAPKKK